MLLISRFGSLCRPLIAISSLLLMPAVLPAQETGKRVALIFGNDAYSVSPLRNAVNDARAIDAALKGSNFRTILVENAKQADMQTKLGEFLDMLGPDDTALFFYAGHGVQIANENFLVPVDFVPGNSLASAKLSTISVALIFEELKAKRARKNIIILDACRSNPVAEKYSLEAGLAQPQNAGKETFVAFSTSIGQVAADNPDGRNSWFTEALADYIGQPTLTIGIDEIFNKVKKRVSDATEGKQTPWVTSSLSGGGFYFHPPLNQDAENDPTMAEKWFDDARRREQRENWAEAIDLINQILKKKPGGTLEAAASSKLQYLMARKEAQEKYDAGDFAGAAAAYERAVKLDPFSIKAAFQGVNSYLLDDRLAQAVSLLKVIRVHGTSASTKKANALLQELSVVSKEAGTELQAGIPQPPAIEEIFGGVHFGVPDWEAGGRRLQSSPVDLSRWTKDLSLPEPAPIQVAQAVFPAGTDAGPVPLGAQATAISNAVFHVELLPAGDKRDLKIRRIGAAAVLTVSSIKRPSGAPLKVITDPPGADLTVEGDAEQHCQTPCVLNLTPSRQTVRLRMDGYRAESRTLEVKPGSNDLTVALSPEFGTVEFQGAQGLTPIILEGRQMAQTVPANVQVPVGKYEIRTIQDGRILSRQDVEVTATNHNVITVKK